MLKDFSILFLVLCYQGSILGTSHDEFISHINSFLIFRDDVLFATALRFFNNLLNGACLDSRNGAAWSFIYRTQWAKRCAFGRRLKVLHCV